MTILQAPFSNVQYSIALKNPELFDNVLLSVRSTYYKSMDGDTYGYKKTPALKKHMLRYINLSRRKALELVQFVKDSAGLEVKYIDKDGDVWKGHILNNPAEVTTDARGRGHSDDERKESNVITIEFEGVLSA